MREVQENGGRGAGKMAWEGGKDWRERGGGGWWCRMAPSRNVAVWEVTDKTVKLIEVQYFGTHERALY